MKDIDALATKKRSAAHLTAWFFYCRAVGQALHDAILFQHQKVYIGRFTWSAMTIKYKFTIASILTWLMRFTINGRDCYRVSSRKSWSTYLVRDPVEFNFSDAPLFILDNWYERFGNNFMQVKNALKYAICCRGKLEIKNKNKNMPHLPSHLDFSIKIAYSNGDSYKPPSNCSNGASGTFFLAIKDFRPPECSYDEYSALQYYIFANEMPYGCVNSHIKCASDLEKALVVHLRSGDIFSSTPQSPIHMYRQPPLAYYRAVFQSRKWERIIVVTSVERRREYNPVWEYLLDKGNAREMIGRNETTISFVLSTSLRDDLRTLWCARTFLASSSTLSYMIIQSGPFLREFYGVTGSIFGRCSTYGARVSAHRLVCHETALPGYEFRSFNWSNADWQREAMISYKLPIG